MRIWKWCIYGGALMTYWVGHLWLKWVGKLWKGELLFVGIYAQKCWYSSAGEYPFQSNHAHRFQSLVKCRNTHYHPLFEESVRCSAYGCSFARLR